MTLLQWNKEFALEQAADDEELLEELLGIFKTSFAADLQLIKDAIKDKNPSQVASAAHSIKGASASLGIDGITQIVKSVEEGGKNGSVEEASNLVSQLEQMLGELNTL
jgi:HPt (histidine-containing phosphotransfer) domain-containing protein